jgi:hypothetical protein
MMVKTPCHREEVQDEKVRSEVRPRVGLRCVLRDGHRLSGVGRDHDRRQRFHRTGGSGDDLGGTDRHRVHRGGVHGDVCDPLDSQAGQVGRVIPLVLGVLAVALATFLATPRTADAFVGESLVVNPTGPTLTESAKTILTNPTFLNSEPALAGSEGTALADTLVGAGALPELGVALPWIAGGVLAAIGTAVVCETFIGGCLEILGFGSDATKTAKLEWTQVQKGGVNLGSGNATVLPGGYYSVSPLYFADDVEAVCGAGSSSLPHYPSERSNLFSNSAGASITCPPIKTFHESTATRTGNENRQIKSTGKAKTTTGVYCAVGCSSTASKPDAGWQEKTAKCLTGVVDCSVSKTAREHLGQQIAHEISPETVDSPYVKYANVPSCVALTYSLCAKKIEELELVPGRLEINWSEVVTTLPDEVLELKPAPKTHLETGTKVTVTTNPKESGMPLVVPHPESGETYSHYAARLNPSLEPERYDLEAAFIDPAVGPNGVVNVSPESGTRLNPASKHVVKVATNPADVPAPAGGWTPPAIPGIDMSPLSGFSPCGVFPFGLFCWVGEAFSQFNTTGVCPGFSAPVADTGSDFEVTLCGETSETIMDYLRPAILLAFTVGLGFLFARGTKAIGDD